MTADPYDVLADYYDLDVAGYDEDIPLYENLGRRHDLPILEVGVGTGRAAIPLARAGLRVLGIDRSEAMLAVARRKVEAEPKASGVRERLTLVQGDITCFSLEERFGLIFSSLGGFLHLHTQEEQLKALECARRHLAPDGLVVMDLPTPEGEEWEPGARPLYLVWTREDPERGVTVSKYRSAEADPANQMQRVTHIYEEWGPEGSRRRMVTFQLRYVHRYEMELLLGQAGLRLRDLYGSYDLSPYDHHATRMIFVAAAAPSGPRTRR